MPNRSEAPEGTRQEMVRRKTFSDTLIRQLNRECQRRRDNGECRLMCDVHGAKVGWCHDVWVNVAHK